FAIAPGYVDTPFNRAFAETVGVEVAAADTGLGEVAQPQDVANVLVFLASGMARHATGTTIDINGASYVRRGRTHCRTRLPEDARDNRHRDGSGSSRHSLPGGAALHTSG